MNTFFNKSLYAIVIATAVFGSAHGSQRGSGYPPSFVQLPYNNQPQQQQRQQPQPQQRNKFVTGLAKVLSWTPFGVSALAATLIPLDFAWGSCCGYNDWTIIPAMYNGGKNIAKFGILGTLGAGSIATYFYGLKNFLQPGIEGLVYKLSDWINIPIQAVKEWTSDLRG